MICLAIDYYLLKNDYTYYNFKTRSSYYKALSFKEITCKIV